MPANLPPQYFEVEKKYREARDLNEKIVYLQQLLSIIPKHKGTEKLQAELKTKIKKQKDALAKQKKSKGSGGTWYQVEKQGAGQVVLVGLPNCGKSSLLNVLTNAHVDVGNYPFTTQLPMVGMLKYENLNIQIVDTPPLYEDAPPWLYGLYRNGDIMAIVLDPNSDMEKDWLTIHSFLEKKNIFLEKSDYGDIKESIIIINKMDTIKESKKVTDFIDTFKSKFTSVAVSTVNSETLSELGKMFFQKLGIIRVYTKKIGQSISKDEPVVLAKGATVLDAAEHIHKDFKRNLKFARLWNESEYSGQRVEKHHVLDDEDVLEFHV